MSVTPIVDDPTRDYGDKVVAVEPGGVEFIPLDERHGTPVQLLWTWTSPNLEFATVAVGILGPLYFGLSFWQTVLAIVLGSALGAVTQGVLSTWGPGHGLAQMVISRSGFGFFGNILPAGLNAAVAGIGWFAVNSVSGALALHALFDGLPKPLCLIIVVAAQMLIAFFGHNLVQAFERYAFPVLAVVFVIASIVVFSKSHPGAAGGGGGIGGFLVMTGATFGYAAGWNPYAADYTRYLPADSSPAKTGLSAGLGVFLSCFVLEVAGAASTSVVLNLDNPTEGFTSPLGSVMGNLTLLAIALGAVAANAINIYSGALSFTAMGFTIPLKAARAITALVFGVLGLIVAFLGLNDISKYENFLLVISYWIGPWLGVYLVDWYLRRGRRVDGFLFDRKHTPYAGWVSMLVGMALSIWLFADQSLYTGLVPSKWPSFGDIAFFVGFLIAGVLYAVIHSIERSREPQEAVLVTPNA
jgi:nucleobase:cation symporter-1, NCS1 family